MPEFVGWRAATSVTTVNPLPNADIAPEGHASGESRKFAKQTGTFAPTAFTTNIFFKAQFSGVQDADWRTDNEGMDG